MWNEEFFSSFHMQFLCLGVKRLIQIPLDVFEIFETNAQADEIRTDASGDLLFFGQLAVSGGSGMNGERAGITNVGKVAEELQAFNELLARGCTALDTEPENRTCAFGQILLGAVVVWVALEPRIFDPADFRMFLKEFSNGLRVLHVTIHAQVEGLKPEQSLPRVEW